MKLSDLARKANRLPDLDFEWGGPECWHDDVFERQVQTLPEAIDYIKELKVRMEDHAGALRSVIEAYQCLKDIMLEAEVGEK